MLFSPRWLVFVLSLAVGFWTAAPSGASPRPVLPAPGDASADADGDGVADATDQCAGTEAGDVVDDDGCGVGDTCPCDGTIDGDAWGTHGAYVQCVRGVAKAMRSRGVHSKRTLRVVVKRARRSTCGNDALTRCCVWANLDADAPGVCRTMRADACAAFADRADIDDAEDIGAGSCDPNPCD